MQSNRSLGEVLVDISVIPKNTFKFSLFSKYSGNLKYQYKYVSPWIDIVGYV